jgi:myo-inositol-1(or 4)-monophosphatase
VRGGGATVGGERLDPGVPERRVRGRLELVGVESADPRWVAEAGDALAAAGHRLRAIGAIAVSLCQVAGGRLDGMLTLRRSRAVDVAAGQLIVREAGGLVAFTGCADPLGAPLDVLEPVSPIVAARSADGLAELAAIHMR